MNEQTVAASTAGTAFERLTINNQVGAGVSWDVTYNDADGWVVTLKTTAIKGQLDAGLRL